MPELPEVQTIVNDLEAAGVIGLRITAVETDWPRIVDTPSDIISDAGTLSPDEFIRHTVGRTFSAVWRRGKYIVFDFLEGGHLLAHLRMSGRLYPVLSPTELSRYEHVRITLSDGRELRFYDPRKFGRLYRLDQAGFMLDRLGIEPLSGKFTGKVLYERLRWRKRLLKPLLLDQSFIAGLGNIYTDEALWEAALHPCRLAASLSPEEARALHRAIRKVLASGLKNDGTTLGNGKTNFHLSGERRGKNREHLKVFRRTDLPCPRCRTPIRRMVVGQRGTHVCPHCQQLHD